MTTHYSPDKPNVGRDVPAPITSAPEITWTGDDESSYVGNVDGVSFYRVHTLLCAPPADRRKTNERKYLYFPECLGGYGYGALEPVSYPQTAVEAKAQCETDYCNGGRAALSHLLNRAIVVLRAAGYRVSKPRISKPKVKAGAPLGLNAIGKPFSPQYDPHYQLKYRPSYGHLHLPYPPTMRFVGDPPPETDKRRRRDQSPQPVPLLDDQLRSGGAARNIRNWKDFPDVSTARAARDLGGEYKIRRWKSGATGEITYAISYRSSAQDWDEIDYPRGKPGTLIEAKRLAEEDHARRRKPGPVPSPEMAE